MTDDPIYNVGLLLTVIIFALAALRPAWAIKILSYGRASPRDVNRTLLRVTRIVLGFFAIYGAADLMWSFIGK